MYLFGFLKALLLYQSTETEPYSAHFQLDLHDNLVQLEFGENFVKTKLLVQLPEVVVVSEYISVGG